ncbi:MFS transporter [Streptomyces sp. JW3]|uniref:MFS transporter n=1 Tax=Streptomyces sp. JW3 TaxID=3456955 RepID=UPI003FA42415
MTYRDVATRPVLTWACTALGARLPVAMAPLALVFLVRDRPGGYSLGAALASVYVLGEIVGAPLLGLRLRPGRARRHLTAGLLAGAAAFAGLGLLPRAPGAALAAFAFLAGAAPAAAAGGLRTLLTELVPERSVAQALSVESILTSGVWAVSPATVTGLALGAAPRIPLLLAAGLMAASAAGLRLLPAGWGGKGGPAVPGAAREPVLRVLAAAWPVYVTGAAGLTLLGLAEIVLPALLEQRGIGVGWAGPLLVGLAVGSAAGALLYGLRSWPGLSRTRSAVLLCGTSLCVVWVALIPGTAAIAAGLTVGGMLQSGALLTRNLALREALPPGALAAGYSVMYAVAGAGYAASGGLAGVLLDVAAPSTAILSGVGLTLALTAAGWYGETRRGPGPRGAVPAPGVRSPGAVPAPGTPLPNPAPAPAAEGPPVGGRGDAEGRL